MKPGRSERLPIEESFDDRALLHGEDLRAGAKKNPAAVRTARVESTAILSTSHALGTAGKRGPSAQRLDARACLALPSVEDPAPRSIRFLFLAFLRLVPALRYPRRVSERQRPSCPLRAKPRTHR